MLSVGYMGSKRQIAPYVQDMVLNLPDGPFLDVFSGMCAIADAVSPYRNVWCNDIQIFASSVAKAFFSSNSLPPTSTDTAIMVYDLYRKNFKKLEDRLGLLIDQEKLLFTSTDIQKIKEFYDSIPHIGVSRDFNNERRWLHYRSSTFPYRLFSITFSGGYFGIEQSIQIDSIRYAIDILLRQSVITKDDHLWMLLALCQALSKVSASTGHFAQFLSINKNNYNYYMLQRKKSIWFEWLRALDNFCPVGEKNWRKKNRVFHGDAFTLIKKLKNQSKHPSVTYADPPYTDDQYSRYYHLYETLLLYDYPSSIGKGRYREDRFRSSFSAKSLVHDSMEKLIKHVALLRSIFILSYPTNGLMSEASEVIVTMMKKYFKKAEIVHEIDHHHSSLGASKGHGKYPVKELLLLGRQ